MISKTCLLLTILFFTTLGFSQTSDTNTRKIHFVAQSGAGFAIWHPASGEPNTVRQRAYNFKFATGAGYNINSNWRTNLLLEYDRMNYAHTVFIKELNDGKGKTHIQPKHSLNQVGFQFSISRNLIDRQNANLRLGVGLTPTFNLDRSVNGKGIFGTVANDTTTSERWWFTSKRQDNNRYFFTKTVYLQQTYKLGKTWLGLRLEFNFFDIGLNEYNIDFEQSPRYESHYNAGGPFLNTNIFFLF